ncbi:serine/threonine protein kinase [Actinobacteria bacterium OK074]|nr:serine/threonine protein kinase [Actinobacteria bacterium OK074]
MDEYAGRVLADRYRLPLPPADEYEIAPESRAFDTYSGQEVLVRQVPLPEVVEAEVLDADGLPEGFVARDGTARRSGSRSAATRRPAEPAVRRAVEAAQAAAQIPDHPRLDQVFDVFAEGGSLWIVSEVVTARPLAALLAEQPLTPYRAAEVAADVLMALRVLHAHGWVHRNITARTVLVCEDGRIVLTGLAAGAAEEALCGYDPVPVRDFEGGGGSVGTGGNGGANGNVGAVSVSVESAEGRGDGGGDGVGVGVGGAAGAGGSGGAGGAFGVEVADAGAARRAAIEARANGAGPAGGASGGAQPAGGPRALEGGTGTGGGGGGSENDIRAARAGAIAAYRAGARAAARVQEEQRGGPPALPPSRPAGGDSAAATGAGAGPAAGASQGGQQGQVPAPAPAPTLPPAQGTPPPPGQIADPYGVGGKTPWHGAAPRPGAAVGQGGVPGPGQTPGPVPAQGQVQGQASGQIQGQAQGHRAELPGGPAAPSGNTADPYGMPGAVPGPYTNGVHGPVPPTGPGAGPYGNGTQGGRLYAPGPYGNGNGAQAQSQPQPQSQLQVPPLPQGQAQAQGQVQAQARRHPSPVGNPVGNGAHAPEALAVAPGAQSGTSGTSGTTPTRTPTPAPRRGPATALAAERARQARMAVVGPVTERWAPEQAGPVHENWQLAAPVGPATDLWALGALLFRAVQGHAPYPEETTAELVQMVCSEPPAFAEECGPLRPVVESLLRQDPTERLDFEELRGWLRSLVRSAPEPDAGTHVVSAPPVDHRPSDPRRLPIKRRRGELVRRRRAGLPVATHARHRRKDGGPARPHHLGRNLLVLVLLALAGALVYAMAFMPKAGSDAGTGTGTGTNTGTDTGGDSRTDGDRTGSSVNPGSSPGSSAGTGQSTPSGGATSSGSTPSADTQTTNPAVADGFTLRKDAAGFQVAVANGWTRTAMNSSGQVVYSHDDFELIVVPGRDSTSKYGSDPLTYQRESELETRPYRDSTWATASGMRQTEVAGRVMAEGQFTWTEDGRELFVRNLAVIIDGHYHVVQVRGPDAEVDEVNRLYEQAEQTYESTG